MNSQRGFAGRAGSGAPARKCDEPLSECEWGSFAPCFREAGEVGGIAGADAVRRGNAVGREIDAEGEGWDSGWGTPGDVKPGRLVREMAPPKLVDAKGPSAKVVAFAWLW